MWYDKYPGVPPRGSPLEALFVHIFLSRQQADLLSTRALVRGQFAIMARSTEAAQGAFEAYRAFDEAMFPFLETAAKQTVDDQARLMEHVRYYAIIDTETLRKERAREHKAKALQKFKVKR